MNEKHTLVNAIRNHLKYLIRAVDDIAVENSKEFSSPAIADERRGYLKSTLVQLSQAHSDLVEAYESSEGQGIARVNRLVGDRRRAMRDRCSRLEASGHLGGADVLAGIVEALS